MPAILQNWCYKSFIMKTLLEDYERRLKTVLEELRVCELNLQKETRLETKASCYRTFISELKRELNDL